ncbi:uncharacterized protein LOC130282829 isoform X2 [Hyla sarda]|uniref:uncharacterized protein LOC130282829 isoform X2 n=1 Tax=Hyla sarda TaxID=327740 RepID=UPI0024C2A8B6|nr:uncharacterized protein LOC130282829 isoform X2 [Hyla sarda]
MEKEKIAKRILNLTLEIIFLLTGEDYILIKKSSEQVSGGWSITQDPIALSPFYSLIHNRKNYEKILELTNTIIELLTGEDYFKDFHGILQNQQYPGGDENPKLISEYKRHRKLYANYCQQSPQEGIFEDAFVAKGNVLEMIPKKNRSSGKSVDGYGDFKEKINYRGSLSEDCKRENGTTFWDCNVELIKAENESNICRLETKPELVRVKIKEEETPTVISPEPAQQNGRKVSIFHPANPDGYDPNEDADTKENNRGCLPPGDKLLTREPNHRDVDILGKLYTEKPENHSKDGLEEDEDDWLEVKIKEENVPTDISSEQFDQYLQELQQSKQREMSGAGPSPPNKYMKQSKKLRAKPFSKNELIDMVQFLDEQGYEHTIAGQVHQKKSEVLNQLSNLLYEKYGTMHSKRQIQKRYSDMKTREQWRLTSIRRKILRVKMLRSESDMPPATFNDDNADIERKNIKTEAINSQS